MEPAFEVGTVVSWKNRLIGVVIEPKDPTFGGCVCLNWLFGDAETLESFTFRSAHPDFDCALSLNPDLKECL